MIREKDVKLGSLPIGEALELLQDNPSQVAVFVYKKTINLVYYNKDFDKFIVLHDNGIHILYEEFIVDELADLGLEFKKFVDYKDLEILF